MYIYIYIHICIYLYIHICIYDQIRISKDKGLNHRKRLMSSLHVFSNLFPADVNATISFCSALSPCISYIHVFKAHSREQAIVETWAHTYSSTRKYIAMQRMQKPLTLHQHTFSSSGETSISTKELIRTPDCFYKPAQERTNRTLDVHEPSRGAK